MNKNIVIIGGGPGGYTAAIRAAQLGAKVTLVEAEHLGGTCLNKGCIPTKALYKNAQVLKDLTKVEEFGVKLEGYSFDIDSMMLRKEEIVNRLKDGIAQLIKANAVELIYGKASLLSNETVRVIDSEGNEKTLSADKIIIATGSVPSKPPISGIDYQGVMNSDQLLSMKKVPDSLVVVGGGVVGIEFAGILNALGSQVTVIEFLPRILANMDSEISKKLTLSLKKSGIAVEVNTSVTQILKTGDSLQIIAEGKKGQKEISVDAVLISTGRTPNIEGLELDSLGVSYDKKGIKVDENYQSNIPGVYAIGDVIGGMMLAHVASEEGVVAVEHIMGLESSLNYDAVPGCVFSFPEVASVGLSEEEAKEKGIDYLSGKFLFGANGKALTLGEAEGFVKILAETNTKRILGAHIMGPHASDLIHEAVVAIKKGITADDFSDIVHAHPTLSEALAEAVLGINNRAIHMVPKRERKG